MGQGKGQLQFCARGMRPLSGRLALGAFALVACFAMLLFFGQPAHALLQHGHTFEGSFGEELGANKDKLNHPTAIAVNEASSGAGAGDIYVLDTGNNRVVRFGPNHEFLEAWGFGVETGAATYQRCSSNCRAGVAGFEEDQFAEPVAIAVDDAAGSPSKGDVYVVANDNVHHTVIDKFSASGTPVTKLVTGKDKKLVEGMVDGIAVDRSGDLWIDREDEESEFLLERYDNQEKNHVIGEAIQVELPGGGSGTGVLEPARPGLAVDSHDDVYVTYEVGGKDVAEVEEEEEEIGEREKARKKAHEELKHETPVPQCTLGPCVVAEYAVHEEEGTQEISTTQLASEVDGQNTTGLAVDLSTGAGADDLYLDHSKAVAAFTPGLTEKPNVLIQDFGAQQLQDAGGKGVAVDGEAGQVLVVDATSGLVDVFDPSPAAAPQVDPGSVGASNLTATSADLSAGVDADGADTHYRFQYDTSSFPDSSPSCSAEQGCVEVPAAPGTDVGQAFGAQKEIVHVGTLTPLTTYHFRVVAENEFAQGTNAVVSEERTLETLPSQLGAALPDGRAWELVTPSEKHGASVEPLEGIGGGITMSASGGNAITYMAAAPIGENEPEGNRSPERSQIVSARKSPGVWTTKDIAAPNANITIGVRSGLPREYRAFSQDLGLSIVAAPSEEVLSPLVTEPTVYRRNESVCVSAPEQCFEPLVTAENDTAGTHLAQGSAPAAGYRVATPDLQQVVFETEGVALTNEASGFSKGLYEWLEGKLVFLSMLPNKTPALTAFVGPVDEHAVRSTAISDDGSHVFWTNKENSQSHSLYVSNVSGGKTPSVESARIDERNTGAPTPILDPAAEFQTASADGAKVFFTDPQRLTTDATASEAGSNLVAPADLYVYEPGKPAGERLTDLSVDLKGGESAAVQGTILGASEDGSFVYFVANGVLASGAQPGNCRFESSANSRCNLYVVHNNGVSWEAPHFIAALSGADDPDWAGNARRPVYQLRGLTARISPNGEYAAFMSELPLTGYENIDQNSGAKDEEVFLYHYGAEHPVCASCNPSGARPTGVHDVEESGEGIGLLVDRAVIWLVEDGVEGSHWLAGNIPGWTANGNGKQSFVQSRYLSDSGRLFFDSSDSLVPRDVNKGKEDVYEYEPTGLGSCQHDNTEDGCVALLSSGESDHESAFLDASQNGDDAFFLTDSTLSPLDTDTAGDVYDARVCEGAGAEPCPTVQHTGSQPCSEEGCRPSSSGSSSAVMTPATAGGSSTGNIVPQSTVLHSKVTKPPTRAQLLTAALLKCHKIKHKKQRASCEKTARRRYGAVHKPANKPAKKSTKTGGKR
jgi:hypothetical protein